jgi:Ser/Thr protein kinase RdoA (MazF antagonist)
VGQVVHCDLKPENVMLLRRDDYRLKVGALAHAVDWCVDL